MPFFKIDSRLVYYAHVPKCGGSSIANYLRDRFGALAFYDTRHHDGPEAARWTKSSPQHVDAAALETLIPLSFFSAMFTFVRHPVSRVVSSYHFQAEVEQLIDPETSFSDWLRGLAAGDAATPFAFDNHIRPMSDIVPEGATVFHMEHGMDQMIPWLDGLAGRADGPRAIPRDNIRGQYAKDGAGGGRAVTPSPEDLALIEQIYAQDFERFGYRPDEKAPLTPPPQIDAAFLAARDRALAKANGPVARAKRKLRNKLQKL